MDTLSALPPLPYQLFNPVNIGELTDAQVFTHVLSACASSGLTLNKLNTTCLTISKDDVLANVHLYRALEGCVVMEVRRGDGIDGVLAGHIICDFRQAMTKSIGTGPTEYVRTGADAEEPKPIVLSGEYDDGSSLLDD